MMPTHVIEKLLCHNSTSSFKFNLDLNFHLPASTNKLINNVSDPFNMAGKQAHGVPALLSFFIPGLGQLIKGQISKAIGIWIALFICGALSALLIGFILGAIVWVWQIYDAYNN